MKPKEMTQEELLSYLLSDESKVAFEEALKKTAAMVEAAKKAEQVPLEALDIVIDL